MCHMSTPRYHIELKSFFIKHPFISYIVNTIAAADEAM